MGEAHEIELKAWLLGGERDRIQEHLDREARFVREAVKDDTYLAPSGIAPADVDPLRHRVVRVRRERAKGGSGATLTVKEKTVSGGVESSREVEVGVDDAAAATALLDYLGLVAFVRKRKEARIYEWLGLTVELNRIRGEGDRLLGEFIEVEHLGSGDAARNASAGAGAVRDASVRLREVLSRLGVPADRLEPALYIDLLRGRAVPSTRGSRG